MLCGHLARVWTDDLRGLRVLVCFDNNEALLARRRTDALRAAGIKAQRLDLRRLGLRTPKGDLRLPQQRRLTLLTGLTLRRLLAAPSASTGAARPAAALGA